MYDFPKFIEKIAEVSNSTIIFVGYSMSASSSLIYASLQPEHAKKYIKIFVEMAPFLYIKHMRSPLKYTGAIWKIVQVQDIKIIIIIVVHIYFIAVCWSCNRKRGNIYKRFF